MSRLRQIASKIPGFDPKNEDVTIKSLLDDPKLLHDTLEDNMPGFSDADEQTRMAQMMDLHSEEMNTQALNKSQARRALEDNQRLLEADQAQAYEKQAVADDLYDAEQSGEMGSLEKMALGAGQVANPVAKGFMNAPGVVGNLVGSQVRAAGNITGLNSIEDYGNSMQELSRNYMAKNEESLPNLDAERTFRESVADGDLREIGRTIVNTGSNLLPDIAMAPYVPGGIGGIIAAKTIPDTIDDVVARTGGEYSAGKAALGTAAGVAEGALMNKAFGNGSVLSNIGVFPALSAAAQTGKEAVVHGINAFENGEMPTMESLQQSGENVWNAGIESVPAAIVAPAFHAQLPEAVKGESFEQTRNTAIQEREAMMGDKFVNARAQMARANPIIPIANAPASVQSLYADMKAGSMKELALTKNQGDIMVEEAKANGNLPDGNGRISYSDENGNTSIYQNPDGSYVARSEPFQTGATKETIADFNASERADAIEISAERAREIAIENGSQGGEGVVVIKNGTEVYYMRPAAEDPTQPWQITRGSADGLRAQKLVQEKGLLPAAKLAVEEGILPPEASSTIEAISRVNPNFGADAFALFTDQYRVAHASIGGPGSIGGRATKLIDKTIIAAFARDPESRQVAIRDMLHEGSHHHYNGMAEGQRMAFEAYVKSIGLGNVDPSETYARLFESHAEGRLNKGFQVLGKTYRIPDWIYYGFQKIGDTMNYVANTFRGMPGYTVNQEMQAILGRSVMSREAFNALEAPISAQESAVAPEAKLATEYAIRSDQKEDPNKWYRIGEDNQYTEFTHALVPGSAPRMSGQRGSGYATGMYAFGDMASARHGAPDEAITEISRPSNPLIVRGKEAPRELQHAAIDMMRFAEGRETGYAGSTMKNLAATLWGLLPPSVHNYDFDVMESHAREAIETWKVNKKVHPMNLLLNKFGYDGVEFNGQAKWAAQSGDYGNVKFPPMTADGDVPGGKPIDSTRMEFNKPENQYVREKAHENPVDRVMSDTDANNDVIPPPGETAYSVHTFDAWKRGVYEWMKKKGYSEEEINGRIGQIETSVEPLVKAAREAGIELMPTFGANVSTDGWTVIPSGPKSDPNRIYTVLDANGDRVGNRVKNVTGKMTADDALDHAKVWLMSKGSESPIRGNSDALYQVSFDLTSICKKRSRSGPLVDAIITKLGRALSASEMRAIMFDLRADGKESPCVFCYVETTRNKAMNILDNFSSALFAENDAEVADIYDATPGSEFLADKLETINKVRSMFQKGGKYAGTQLSPELIDAKYFANLDAKAEAQADKNHPVHKFPELYEELAVQYGGGLANSPKPYVEYRNHFLGKLAKTAKGSAKLGGDNLWKYLNDRAGVRFQSSSDFQIEHAIDVMQAISDLSMVEMRSHVYTKVEDYVKIFKDTGQKINLSLFAKPDGNGGFVADESQSWNFEKAKHYRDNHKDVGTILVASSDAQILWALDQPWIDQIIPYHSSQMPTEVFTRLGWKNYESYQHEKWIKAPEKSPDTLVEKTNKKTGEVTQVTKKGTSEKPDIRHVDLMRKAREQTGKGEKETAFTDEELTSAYRAITKEKGLLPIFLGAFQPGKGEAGVPLMFDGKPFSYPKEVTKKGVKSVIENQVFVTEIGKKILEHPRFAKVRKDYARTDTSFDPVKPVFDTKAAMELQDKFLKDGGVAGQDLSNRADPELVNRLAAEFEDARARGANIGIEKLDRMVQQGGVDPETAGRVKKLMTNYSLHPDPATDAILKKINQDPEQVKRTTWKDLYRDWVDDLKPLQDAVAELTGGAELPAGTDPYKLARLTRGSMGRAETFLRYKPFDPDSMKFTGKGLEEILSPLDGKLNEFRAYLVAKRSIEKEGQGKLSGFDLQAANDVVTKYGTQFAQSANDLYAYQNSLLEYSLKRGLINNKDYLNIKSLNKSYVPFYRIIEATGTAGPNAGGKTLEQVAKTIRTMKGSDKDIADPLESIVKNTYAFITAAERNNVGKALVDLAEATPGQTLVEKQPMSMENIRFEVNKIKKQLPQDVQDMIDDLGISDDVVSFFRPEAQLPGPGTLAVWKNGERALYKIDPEIEKAMKGLNREDMNMITKILSYPAKALRLGSTLAPEFAMRNPVRDQWSAFLQTKFGYIPGYDFIRGMTHYVAAMADGGMIKGAAKAAAKALGGGEELYWKWKASGGANATMVAMDRASQKEALNDLTREKPELLKNLIRSPIDFLRTFSEFTEESTRLGEYARGLSKKADPMDAALSSRDLTLDFAKMGAKAQAANSLIAFWNAGIQGHQRMAETMMTNPLRSAGVIAAMMGISAGLSISQGDDPRYKDVPDWQKDLFWVWIGGKKYSQEEWDTMNPEQQAEASAETIYRIPKPPGALLLFPSILERVVRYKMESDPKAFDGFAWSFMRDQLPSIVPTALIPPAEAWANKSRLTDSPIVPGAREGALPMHQYNPNTPNVYKGLSRAADWAGQNVPGLGALKGGFSPAKAENMVRGYTGGLGTTAVNAADSLGTAIGKGFTGDQTQAPASTLADIPGIKGFIVRYPGASKEVTRFWDNYNSSSQYNKSAAAMKDERNYQEFAKYKTSPEAVLKLDKFAAAMRNLHTVMELHKESKTLSGAQKKKLMDAAAMQIIRLAKAGNNFYENTLESMKGRAQNENGGGDL